MSSRRRITPPPGRLVGLAGAIVLSLTAMPGGQTPQKRTTWRDYGGGPDNARYVELDQIDRRSLPRLGVAWTYPTYDNTAYHFGPIVVDDVAYVLARNNSLVALDARSGKEIWIHAELQGMAPRGINYWESADRSDRRLLFQRNSYLEAIDAKTGKSILTFGTNGAVNLREGPRPRPGDRIAASSRRIPARSSRTCSSWVRRTGEGYLSAPGDLRAFDVVTGKLAWQFHTVPHPGEFGYETWPKDAYKYIGGANTWGEISIDAARGIAYFPTGSPTYDYYGADRIGANLFGDLAASRSTRAPASGCGTSRWSTTTSGTTTTPPRRSSPPSGTTGSWWTSSRRPARPDSSTSSIA